ncbi:MAG: hypothetical protein ACRDGF_04125 [Chloroflexota bacterium]
MNRAPYLSPDASDLHRRVTVLETVVLDLLAVLSENAMTGIGYGDPDTPTHTHQTLSSVGALKVRSIRAGFEGLFKSEEALSGH